MSNHQYTSIETTTTTTSPADFVLAVTLMSVYAEQTLKHKALENEISEIYRQLVEDKAEEAAQIQDCLLKTETALREISARNPDWFTDARNQKTPYGTFGFHRSTELQITDEADTLTRIKARFADPGLFIITREEPSKKALEPLDDASLACLGVTRESKDTFSVKPLKVELGKTAKGKKSPAKTEVPNA